MTGMIVLVMIYLDHLDCIRRGEESVVGDEA
jgi:hypothetical protein